MCALSRDTAIVWMRQSALLWQDSDTDELPFPVAATRPVHGNHQTAMAYNAEHPRTTWAGSKHTQGFGTLSTDSTFHVRANRDAISRLQVLRRRTAPVVARTTAS